MRKQFVIMAAAIMMSFGSNGISLIGKLEGAQLMSQDPASAQWCCWKLVNGVWMCRPEFC